MPFKGYAVGTVFLGRAQAGLESANRTFAFFADNAGCSAAVRIEAVPDVNPADRSTAEKRVRGGWRHLHSVYPTQRGSLLAWSCVQSVCRPYAGARLRGGVNEDIDSGSVIWTHFQQTLRH